MHNLEGRCISNWQGLNIAIWGNWTVSSLMEVCRTRASTPLTVSDRNTHPPAKAERQRVRTRDSEQNSALSHIEWLLRWRCHDGTEESVAYTPPSSSFPSRSHSSRAVADCLHVKQLQNTAKWCQSFPSLETASGPQWQQSFCIISVNDTWEMASTSHNGPYWWVF